MFFTHTLTKVKELLDSCTKFEQTEMIEISEKVRKLLTLYQSLRVVPKVRAHYSTLQAQWESFENEVRKLLANMELAVKFHEVMLIVSVDVVMMM